MASLLCCPYSKPTNSVDFGTEVTRLASPPARRRRTAGDLTLNRRQWFSFEAAKTNGVHKTVSSNSPVRKDWATGRSPSALCCLAQQICKALRNCGLERLRLCHNRNPTTTVQVEEGVLLYASRTLPFILSALLCPKRHAEG